MTETPFVTSVYAALPVRDVDEAAAWYTTLLGPTLDALLLKDLAEFYPRGGDDAEADRATVQLVRDPDRAGGGLVTINVSDARALAHRLATEGLTLALEPASRGGLVGRLTDPDGNVVTFVQH